MVDTVPVPASMYRDGTYIGIEMPIFHTSLNTGRTVNFGYYWLVPKKNFSFVILNFCKGIMVTYLY